jgi:Ribbon-helix-helix protein, copG family
MNPPNVARQQQSILLDHGKAEKLDRLAQHLGVSKQALMREAIDDFLSVHGMERSPRIHAVRHLLTLCELRLTEVRSGKLSEPDVQAACAEALVHIARILGELGDPRADRTRRQLVPRGKV